MELEYTLDSVDQSNLASIVKTAGFNVLLNIARSECNKFVTHLLNVPSSKSDEVLAAHNQAQTAARLLTQFINRINEEMLVYRGDPNGKEPIDPTEGILDLGDAKLDRGKLIDLFEER